MDHQKLWKAEVENHKKTRAMLRNSMDFHKKLMDEIASRNNQMRIFRTKIAELEKEIEYLKKHDPWISQTETDAISDQFKFSSWNGMRGLPCPEPVGSTPPPDKGKRGK